VLEVKNVSKVYGEGENRVVAVNDVSLTIPDGGFTAIMGASGSGKTTLLNIIGVLDHISAGEIILDGVRIDNLDEHDLVDLRRSRITNVFQHFHLLPSLTALENVLLPAAFAGRRNGHEKAALDMLARVGLAKRAHHKPSQLSGGEQQRVAIARAMIHHPSVILADEPTGNLDQATGGEILSLFEELNRDGLSVIMVTHNPDVARRASEIVVLKDGQIIDRIIQKGSGGRK
jgi:putative ABC transport system ATP-binding protein